MLFTYVYVLRSDRDGKFYVGMTNDLRRRVLQHQSGQNVSTVRRLPVKLVFYEAYLCASDARRREIYLKTVKGKTTLRAMLREYLTSHLQKAGFV